MKPGNAPLKSIRLLDQVRERIRYLHYSLSTEKVYLYWVKFFVRWHGRDGRMKHPRDMGPREVEAFLTMLATERKVSKSTHNQALSAILFLYREVLAIKGIRLRVKDVDFDRLVIIVREAKGGKDRVVMLPRSLAPFVCDPSTASRHRHPHGARAAGSFRCVHHHDLHPRFEGGSRRHGQPSGCVVK